jgi:hypothetical protein
MLILRILAGGALIALGRKLFWLFVAGVGFFTAIELATRFLHGQPDWLVVLLALAVGLVGALLAVFFQGVAIWLAGFISGGYFTLSMLTLLGIHRAGWAWIVFLLGGVAGGVLVAIFFDWALILLSSLGGALMITQSFRFLTRPMAVIVWVGLTLIGIVFQAVILIGEKRPPHRQRSPS